MRNPINSNKHIVQQTLTSIAEASTVNLLVADAQQEPTASNAFHVIQGAVIEAVFLEYWLMSEGNQPTFGLVTVEKVPGTATNMVHTDAVQLYSYANKKNILFTSQGLIGDSNSNPIPVIRQWIKIPKGKQRFGLGDRLNVNVTCLNPTTGEGLEVCGVAVYKELR